MSTILPVLFSNVLTTYSLLPPLYAGTANVVVAGQRYRYNNRIWEALTSGTVTAYPASTDAYMATAHEDTPVYPTLVVSGVSFRDVSGDPSLGWECAIGSYPSLLAVTNPSLSSSPNPQRPTLANNTVLFDSNSTAITRRADGIERDSGLCMWGYWDFSNEVGYGTFSGGAAITVCPQVDPSDSLRWVSVDASHADMPPKKGAVLQFKPSTSTSPMFIGGLGYVEGFILDILAPARFSGTTRTVSYLWLHDCDFLIREAVDTAIIGRANVISRTPTTEAIYVDIYFTASNIELWDSGSFSICGRFCFEECTLVRSVDRPFFYALCGITHLTLTASDFSQVSQDTPLYAIATTCPYLHIKFDNCTGLVSTHVPRIDSAAGTSYLVEIIGGELDGEYDPHRYIAYTESYTMVVTSETYPYSSLTAPTGGLTSIRYETTDWLEEGFSFCQLHRFNSWSEAGVVRVAVELLLPAGTTTSLDSLWFDCGVCGADSVEVWSSKTAQTPFVLDEESVWVNSDGAVAYTCSGIFRQAFPGTITATLYCAIPNTTIHVRPNLDIRIIGTI